MAEQIKDGTGRGFLLEINSRHKAETDSVIQSEESYISEHEGSTYITSTGLLTLNSTNLHQILYFKNTSPTKNLFFSKLAVSYNGGSTNYDRTLYWSWHIATSTVPSSNATMGVMGNANLTSANAAPGVVYYWDESASDGMTVLAVFDAGGMIVGSGASWTDLEGSVILGFNDALTISVIAEEIGDVAIAARVFFKDSVTAGS
jgi:hypothetical protein